MVYLNPSLTERPVAFNPLGGVPFALRHQRAAAITESIRALHPNSWGDRLDWILYNSLRALLDTESSTLLDVPRLLVDDHFRSSVTRQIKDPAVRGFWLDEFASYDRAFRTIAVAPVQNKVGKLVAHPPLRAVLGHARAQLSFETVLKRQQLVMAQPLRHRRAVRESLGLAVCRRHSRGGDEQASRGEVPTVLLGHRRGTPVHD